MCRQRIRLIKNWRDSYVDYWKKMVHPESLQCIRDIVRTVYRDNPKEIRKRLAILDMRAAMDPEDFCREIITAHLREYRTAQAYRSYLTALYKKTGGNIPGYLKKELAVRDAQSLSREVEVFRTALPQKMIKDYRIVGHRALEEVYKEIERLVETTLGRGACGQLEKEIKAINDETDLVIRYCFPHYVVRSLAEGTMNDEFVKLALIARAEDGPDGAGIKATRNMMIKKYGNAKGMAFMIAKEDGIVAGVNAAKIVFQVYNPSLKVKILIQDGAQVHAGDIIMTVEGDYPSITKAERPALNLIQRMSGIATMTARVVDLVRGKRIKIYDTRKIPAWYRLIDKAAVLIGGGYNHRIGMFDQTMGKDTNFEYGVPGSIAKFVEEVRKINPFEYIIIECETIEQVEEAIACEVDRILLDNMRSEEVKNAVLKIRESVVYQRYGKPLVECSGGMTPENIPGYVEAWNSDTYPDIISVGLLTHTVKALDISLKKMPQQEYIRSLIESSL